MLPAAPAIGVVPRIRSPVIVPPALFRALKDKKKYVRQMAAYALAEMLGAKAEAAIPVLKNGLKARDPFMAADALGEIGPKAASAVPALTKLLKHKNSKVRRAAAEALTKIRGR